MHVRHLGIVWDNCVQPCQHKVIKQTELNHELFGAQSLPSKMPWTRWLGLSCCLRTEIFVYARTAASRAFCPSQGERAAWALLIRQGSMNHS